MSSDWRVDLDTARKGRDTAREGSDAAREGQVYRDGRQTSGLDRPRVPPVLIAVFSDEDGNESNGAPAAWADLAADHTAVIHQPQLFTATAAHNSCCIQLTSRTPAAPPTGRPQALHSPTALPPCHPARLPHLTKAPNSHVMHPQHHLTATPDHHTTQRRTTQHDLTTRTPTCAPHNCSTTAPQHLLATAPSTSHAGPADPPATRTAALNHCDTPMPNQQTLINSHTCLPSHPSATFPTATAQACCAMQQLHLPTAAPTHCAHHPPTRHLPHQIMDADPGLRACGQEPGHADGMQTDYLCQATPEAFTQPHPKLG